MPYLWVKYLVLVLSSSRTYSFNEHTHWQVSRVTPSLLFGSKRNVCSSLLPDDRLVDCPKAYNLSPSIPWLCYTMNLDKVSEEEKLKISRKYFILGFFLLPVVWLANAVWFFREAFIKKHGHPKIRRYVAWSMIGVLVWVAVVVIWTSVYQTQRPNWGAAGDYISFTVPVGKL